jgi:hypothetical protein
MVFSIAYKVLAIKDACFISDFADVRIVQSSHDPGLTTLVNLYCFTHSTTKEDKATNFTEASCPKKP